MKLNELRPRPGSRKREKRIGHGVGSGHGKTSTKGHKGQSARTGGGKGPGFEGGQMPLIRRIPKRGFKNPFRIAPAVVNLEPLNQFDGKVPVTPEKMKEAGLVRRSADLVKVLGVGELKKPLTVLAHRFSRSAMDKIQKAGGKAQVIETRKTAAGPGAPASTK